MAPSTKPPCGHWRASTECGETFVRKVCPDCGYDARLPRCPKQTLKGRQCRSFVYPGDEACHSHTPGRMVGARASRTKRSGIRLDLVPVGPPGMTRSELARLWEMRDPDQTLANMTERGDLRREVGRVGQAAHYWRPEPPMSVRNIGGGALLAQGRNNLRSIGTRSKPPMNRTPVGHRFIGGVGPTPPPPMKTTGPCEECGLDAPRTSSGRFFHEECGVKHDQRAAEFQAKRREQWARAGNPIEMRKDTDPVRVVETTKPGKPTEY